MIGANKSWWKGGVSFLHNNVNVSIISAEYWLMQTLLFCLYFIYLFMYGCAGSSLLHTDFFLKVASSGHSTVGVCELLLLKSMDSSVQRLQELWHTGSRVQA